jgi:hypothetical protein
MYFAVWSALFLEGGKWSGRDDKLSDLKGRVGCLLAGAGESIERGNTPFHRVRATKLAD